MPRILLVDDDRDILDIVRLDLQDDSANAVDTTSTAKDALEQVKRSRYDVIISDWRMPGMNGIELIQKLRSDGCNAYIILYSGFIKGADIRHALDCGADYYLHRGGDPDKEFADIHRLINGIAKRS